MIKHPNRGVFSNTKKLLALHSTVFLRKRVLGFVSFWHSLDMSASFDILEVLALAWGECQPQHPSALPGERCWVKI